MIKQQQLINEITKSMSMVKYFIQSQNSIGCFDINKYCEDFFAGLLNVVYDINLINLNNIQYNYPAVDLGDVSHKACVQVTSTNDRGKIEYTINKFEENKLFNIYNTLCLFILGDKKEYRKAFVYQAEKYAFYIKDINLLLTDIARLPLDRMELVCKYLNSTIDVNRNNGDKELFEEFNSEQKDFIMFLKGHDFAIEPTYIEGVLDKIDKMCVEWGIGDKSFSNNNFNKNIQCIVSQLQTIRAYITSPVYFRQHTDNTIAAIKSPSRVEFNEVLEKTFECRQRIINSYINMIQIYNELYK